MKYIANYEKHPFVQISDCSDACTRGWTAITGRIKEHLNQTDRTLKVVAVECYQGVFEEEMREAFTYEFNDAVVIHTTSTMLAEQQIDDFFHPDITDDEVFGYMTRHTIDCFFDVDKVNTVRRQIAEKKSGIVIIYGVGAGYICENPDLLVYADMARWEIQTRFRRNEVSNIGISNKNERTSLQYKRAFFVDWRICDRHKKEMMPRIDYVLDTNQRNCPKMITGKAMYEGLEKAVNGPFRVVPFFDPGPWGGQWMKDICGLDKTVPNYAWCFDCVPEENSLLLAFGDERVEIPSINLIFAYPRQLLGDAVYGRFGDEFPIRFDFLDTMQGGNLSLQVHPLTEYIQQKFGMHYTQDESYYILDAKEGATVYLGLKENIEPEKMLEDLRQSQNTGQFDAEQYVGIYPAKKHDHFLIPAGTIHCSGRNSMVLEISATPFIFTFKLWDWGRMGLDGRPRPINIAHGANVIQWNRTESWVKKELINNVSKVAEGKEWYEEKTGLHQQEFIETRRHWFTGKVLHKNNEGVNVLNLIEGRAAIVESPTNQFSPFVVHYAETFIIPATVKEYTITPYGEAEETQCGTIKAFVRHHA
ncbi:class I mannose-6-phosphate isomerase [Bacteroides sp.]|uniref:class I mannose-6-phosphate isomerase n=1 Tax=Bacteroides sp. TaxID=29523 RepID=UPI0026145E7D|nr:class I mannose-6-phosphate isomerase [Bacteroides sp.]